MTAETSENTIFFRFYFTLCYLMLTTLTTVPRSLSELEGNLSSRLSNPVLQWHTIDKLVRGVLHLRIFNFVPSLGKWTQAVKRVVEKVIPARERQTNSSWTMSFKCWAGLTKHLMLWKQNPTTRSSPLWMQDLSLHRAVCLIEGSFSSSQRLGPCFKLSSFL